MKTKNFAFLELVKSSEIGFFFLIMMTLFQFQDENRQLVDRLIKYKAKDAEKLNEENESFLKYVKFF